MARRKSKPGKTPTKEELIKLPVHVVEDSENSLILVDDLDNVLCSRLNDSEDNTDQDWAIMEEVARKLNADVYDI